MNADPLFDPPAIAHWAQQVGIARFMGWYWGWPITEIVHFTGLCMLFGTVALYDLRMLGVARGVSLASLQRLIPVGLAGFTLNVCSGFMFVVTMPDQYLYNPAFQIKLCLIIAAGLNVVLFYAIAAGQARVTPEGELPPWRARLFGTLSLLCWLGVIACGRVITLYRPSWHWCAWC